MRADGDNIIILYYCHQRSSFISHAIHHIELLSLFTTAILCFICIFLIFAMSVSHHNSLSLRDRFTCLFGAVVAIMIIAVLALLSFSSFSITFFLIVVAIIVFVIIALFCFFFILVVFFFNLYFWIGQNHIFEYFRLTALIKNSVYSKQDTSFLSGQLDHTSGSALN